MKAQLNDPTNPYPIQPLRFADTNRIEMFVVDCSKEQAGRTLRKPVPGEFMNDVAASSYPWTLPIVQTIFVHMLF